MHSMGFPSVRPPSVSAYVRFHCSKAPLYLSPASSHVEILSLVQPSCPISKMSVSTPANPFILTLLQFATQIFILGFTTPSSLLRFAALPIQLTCEYLIFKNVNYYMRPAWAQSYAPACFAMFVMNYLEIALLRKWSFEGQGPVLHPPSAKPLPLSKGSTGPNFYPKPHDTILNRLLFGFHSSLSFRDPNTPHESRNTPRFSTSDPSYIPSKSTFLLRAFLSFTITYLVIDLAESLPPPDPARFTTSHVPVFLRPGGPRSMTLEEVVNRILTTTAGWFTAYCFILGVGSLFAFIAVGTGLTPVSSWPPLFGSFTDAYTLRALWGYVLPLPSSPSSSLPHTPKVSPTGAKYGKRQFISF
jgi:hypothetical protein